MIHSPDSGTLVPEDARREQMENIKELMVECMTIPIQINDRILKIPVNTKHGYDWNEVS